MLQDSKGIVWIGTNDGLNRYDGKSFIQYNVLSRPALCNGVVTALFQDSTGDIWIGTEGGLNILDPRTDSLRQFVYEDRRSGSLPRGPVRAIRKMKDGATWILSDNWIVRTGPHHLFSPVHLHPSLLENNMVLVDLAEDAGGRIWLSYLDHVTALAGSPIKKDNGDSLGPASLWTPDYARISSDPQTGVWGISCDGVSLYDSSRRNFGILLNNGYTTPVPNLHVHTCFCIDAEGCIWQGAERVSLVKYDLRQKKTIDYRSLLTAVKATMVYFLYADNSNNIWVGTDNGIIKIPNNASFFRTMPFVAKDKTLEGIRCRRIIEDRNKTLYAGTENHGLLRREPASTGEALTTPLSTFGAFPISALPIRNNAIHVPLTGAYDIGYIYDMWYDGGNVVWTAGYSIGRYDITGSSLDIFLPDGDDQTRRESITQFAICNDDSLLWTGGQVNIYTFDLRTKCMRPFRDDKGAMPFYGTPCWSLVKKGKWIWAGTHKGLYKIDSHTREVFKVAAAPALEYGINDIFLDSDGSFWISTAGGGIVHYDENTRLVRQYTNQDGLSNNTVCGILADNDHNLWISTYAGLNYLDRQTGQFTNFYEKDGLSIDEFNRKAFARLADGRMVFGGLNGYVVFNPADAFRSKRPLHLLLTRFSRTNHTGTTTETIFGADTIKKVVIYPGDTFFSFGFTLTNMYDPSGNSYTYTLKGLDDGWHSVGSTGVLSFTSLPAGKYTLVIRGRIAKGSVAQNEIVVDLVVRQVFYRTPWFIISMALLALAVLYLILRYRIHQLKKWQRLRTRIASDLHDEVGSQLVRITLLADAVKREGVKENTDEQLGAIAGISRGAISTMKDVIWSIDGRNDALTGLVNHMHEHMHDMLSPAGIEFEFRHAGLPEQEKLRMDLRQHIYLIFKEAINNIVKHAQASMVYVSLERNNGLLTMQIRDNGKGISKTARFSGQGIKNMKMRAARIRAKLQIIPDNGVTIILVAPWR
jgi:signal transduction histidine kinase/ligand-binding sensor domain-containing protein